MLVSLIFIDSLLIGHELNSPQSFTEYYLSDETQISTNKLSHGVPFHAE